MNEAVLLSGDLDFKPLVDALVNLGTRVTVWAERSSVSEDLLRSADRRRVFGLNDALRFLSKEDRERFRLYGQGANLNLSGSKGTVPEVTLTSFSLLDRKEVRIKKVGPNYRVEVDDKAALFAMGGNYWMHNDLAYVFRCIRYELGIQLPDPASVCEESGD